MAGAVMGVGWLLYDHWIAPLSLRKQAFLNQRVELQQEIEATRKKLGAIKDSEQKLGSARAQLNALIGDETVETTMTSFPRNLADHFTRFGLPAPTIRFAKAQPEPDLSGYQRLFWVVGISLPASDKGARGL